MLEDFYQDSEQAKNLLKATQDFFITELSLTPVMAIELEFFFMAEEGFVVSDEQLDELADSVKTIAINHGLKLGNVSKEVGRLQYEVNFKHSKDLLKVAGDAEKIKDILGTVAKSYNLSVCFIPKPYKNLDVGSGMHVHLSLYDQADNNLFVKHNDEESPLLLNIIGGLLKYLPASLPFFLAAEQDFERFNAKFELSNEERRYKCNATNAPTNISWGVNNRTTALRIPDSRRGKGARRVEHRVPASSANPYLVLTGVLLGAYLGVRERLDAPDRIWGNAFDEQYKLESLPLNLKEANSNLENSEIRKIFDQLKNKA